MDKDTAGLHYHKLYMTKEKLKLIILEQEVIWIRRKSGQTPTKLKNRY